MNLQRRVALITGGAGHIGQAMAEALAELGVAIALLDRDHDAVMNISEHLQSYYNIETLPIVMDLEDEKAVQTVPSQVVDRFGGFNILINNAAFVGDSKLVGWATEFREQSSATWRQALEVNLTSVFVLSQTSSDILGQSGNGVIINVGSIYGVVGPDPSLYAGTTMGNPAAYAASKGGLLQLTRWLATTLAPAVRVNAISPGGVWRNQADTFHQRYIQKTPLGRMATEEDFKGAVAYLASDLSAYVTGHNLVVDGGWSTW